MGAGWQRWWWAEDERFALETQASDHRVRNHDVEEVSLRLYVRAALRQGHLGCHRCGASATLLGGAALWCKRCWIETSLDRVVLSFNAPGFSGKIRLSD